MLSDIQVYYRSKDNLILPFIVAPVAGHQDSLILSPDNLTKEHDDFVNELYKTMPNHTPSSVYLRVFRYGSWVAISIVFPSSLVSAGANEQDLFWVWAP